MLNDLEQMAASQCIFLNAEAKKLSEKMRGNDIKKLSEIQIWDNMHKIISNTEQVDRWLRAMIGNSCNCQP